MGISVLLTISSILHRISESEKNINFTKLFGHQKKVMGHTLIFRLDFDCYNANRLDIFSI